MKDKAFKKDHEKCLEIFKEPSSYIKKEGPLKTDVARFKEPFILSVGKVNYQLKRRSPGDISGLKYRWRKKWAVKMYDPSIEKGKVEEDIDGNEQKLELPYFTRFVYLDDNDQRKPLEVEINRTKIFDNKNEMKRFLNNTNIKMLTSIRERFCK